MVEIVGKWWKWWKMVEMVERVNRANECNGGIVKWVESCKVCGLLGSVAASVD